MDDHVRVSSEALVLHTWYVDLWDVRADDTAAWNPKTLRNIIAFVERDRQAIDGTGAHAINRVVSALMRYLLLFLCHRCLRQAFNDLLRKLKNFMPFLPGQLEQNFEEFENIEDDGVFV